MCIWRNPSAAGWKTSLANHTYTQNAGASREEETVMDAIVTPIIILNAADDVGVVRRSVQAGNPVGHGDLIARDLIGRGHKVAIRHIPSGAEVKKYGQVIGVATQDIEPGSHVHLHNLAMLPSEHEHQFSVDIEEKGMLPEAERRTFMGYDRGFGGA